MTSFKSDGCTGWFEELFGIVFTPCCTLHDRLLFEGVASWDSHKQMFMCLWAEAPFWAIVMTGVVVIAYPVRKVFNKKG